MTPRWDGRRIARSVGAAIAASVLVASCTGGGGAADPTTSTDRPARGQSDAAADGSVEPTTPTTPTVADHTDRRTADGVDDGATPPDDQAGGFDTAPTSPPDGAGLPGLGEIDPAIVGGTLDNGLRYLIRANDKPGRRVEMRLVIDAGSALEDADQGGGAHFLEHMLFNGTERYPANELVAVLRSFGAAFGADVNARTSYDDTVYELTVPTDDDATVETGLDVLEQWLTSALIDPDEVVAERGVVLDEWRRSEESPGGRISDAVEALFLTGSDYEGRDPIGTADDIRTTTDDALERFYDEWYRPDNAAVIVVGDIDPDRIESQIVRRFGGIAARGDGRARPELDVAPDTEPNAVVLPDPGVADGFAMVALPHPVDRARPVEERLQWEILAGLAFDVVATRLNDDALRGDAPFESARAGGRRLVRALDAPEIVVDVDGDRAGAAIESVVEELERVRRFGLTVREVERAVAARRRAAQTVFDGRDTRQDADYAAEYVRHVLAGEPVPTAERDFRFVEAVLDRADPETVAHVLVDRLAQVVPHVLVVVPEDESDGVPSSASLERVVAQVGERDLEPRAEGVAGVDSLMDPPDPVGPVAVTRLDGGFVEPRVLTFANGVRVALTRTPVVEGSVAFDARSPGGLAVVADDAVADARAAGPVLARSGAGALDPVALDELLADRDVGLVAVIDQFTEGFEGFAATSDLETLFQLVHLAMTAPRVDDVALQRYVDDQLAIAEDPFVDPGYAELVTLLDARYDDPRRLQPTVESLGTVDAAGVEAVAIDRFGDASDFSFSFAGDLDLDEAQELAARYLGPLPGGGRVDAPVVADPPPPPGVVVEEVRAGDGARGNVSFQFTVPATAERRVELIALLANQVVSNRLTDTIREELGESYSPYAVVGLTDGGEPYAETYVSVSTAPEQVDAVSEAVRAELGDLGERGPTAAEFEAASMAVVRDLELFSNPQVNDEVLRELTGEPGGRFAEFPSLASIAASITADEVAAALSQWLPADEYIEVRVRPR